MTWMGISRAPNRRATSSVDTTPPLSLPSLSRTIAATVFPRASSRVSPIASPILLTRPRNSILLASKEASSAIGNIPPCRFGRSAMPRTPSDPATILTSAFWRRRSTRSEVPPVRIPRAISSLVVCSTTGIPDTDVIAGGMDGSDHLSWIPIENESSTTINTVDDSV